MVLTGAHFAQRYLAGDGMVNRRVFVSGEGPPALQREVGGPSAYPNGPFDTANTANGATVAEGGPRRHFLTLGEAAVRVGLSSRTIRRYIHDGKLVSARLPGGVWMVAVRDLDALFDTHRWGPR